MDSSRAQKVAGVAFVGTGALTLLGFVTAAALFPGYSIATETISALGAAGVPAGSRAVFNATMVVSGLLLVVGAYGLHRTYGRHLLTGLVAITGGVGFVGVGLFPAGAGLSHFVAAMVAFVGAGATALTVATVVRGAFGALAAVFGVLELSALVAFVAVGGANPLGVGGLERWVAYLGLVWAIAFGGYLLAGDGDRG